MSILLLQEPVQENKSPIASEETEDPDLMTLDFEYGILDFFELGLVSDLPLVSKHLKDHVQLLSTPLRQLVQELPGRAGPVHSFHTFDRKLGSNVLGTTWQERILRQRTTRLMSAVPACRSTPIRRVHEKRLHVRYLPPHKSNLGVNCQGGEMKPLSEGESEAWNRLDFRCGAPQQRAACRPCTRQLLYRISTTVTPAMSTSAQLRSAVSTGRPSRHAVARHARSPSPRPRCRVLVG